MASWEDIHIRQRIELDLTISGQTRQYSGIVVRKNDKELCFPIPTTGNATSILKKGLKVEVKVYLGDEVMKFAGEIASVVPGNPPQAVIARPTGEMAVKKQASGFELKEKINLEYRFLKDMTTPVSDFKKGFTESLSSTDLSIVTASTLRSNQQVEINLQIDPETTVNFVASPAGESAEKEVGNRQMFFTDVHIEMIQPGEQDKIVKLIFKKQRSLRRRGMA